ncbi:MULTISPECIES: hypothetical protein [unclassified Rhodococcus (in: high G+C Gram-positive bacteria)]|uniref:hypothetical protein n=1 Tax=unclassified Rhodococcus (in: high G+C Gram-positive bacteria) TaxID=192944 RepID=UPI0012E3437B|nr:MULTISPECIES: hypothetical protein [unclassified Rhodococcus (in: high G+C Gram-positive bacteria)]
MDWTHAAEQVRRHAQEHADRLAAETGTRHRMDPAYYRLAAQCDAAAYSPTVPKPKLERAVKAALTTEPKPTPSWGSFDLSSGTGV